MVADVEAVTDVVVTVKFALVAPAGTVTLAGTAAALESSESETAPPPVGAAALNVTVPVEAPPPTRLVGFSDTADRVAPVDPDGLMVSVALRVTFSYAAEITTVVVEVTCAVLTVNVARV